MTLNIPLSLCFFPPRNYSLVAPCHYLSSRSSFICSLIYGASSLCQLHQDHGQLHKHFPDKDGQLFTDKAKVLLAAATIWARMCVCARVCVLEKERGREWEREGITKRAPNVQPLLVLATHRSPLQGHIFQMHLKVFYFLGLCPSSTKYRAEGKRHGALSLPPLIHSHLHFL